MMKLRDDQVWQDNYWSSEHQSRRYVRRVVLIDASTEPVLVRVVDDTTPFKKRGQVVQIRRSLFNNRPADRFGYCLVNEETVS